MRDTSERIRAALAMSGLAAGAVLIGRLSATNPTRALMLLVLPLALIAAWTPSGLLVSAVVALPFQIETLPSPGGLRIGISDVLLLFGLGGMMLAVLAGERIEIRRTSALLPAVTVYFCALLVAWVHVPSVGGVATMVQRFELVVVAICVGAFLAHRGRLEIALNGYVLAAAVIAVVAVAVSLFQGTASETFLGIQKNPAGQAIANGLLLALFSREIRWRLPLAIVLILGLIAAQSRGAILATILAATIATVVASSNRRTRAVAAVPLVVGVAFAAFSALPTAQQNRLLNTSAEGGDVATEVREQYAADAIATFKGAPALGVGVGRYFAGNKADLTQTTDPHNVLLLEAAEGGVVLVGAFALMCVTSAWVLVRRRLDHPMVVPALAVQVSTVLHGVVDVYWVRGTPVLGWLLVGAALFLASKERERRRTEPSEQPSEGSAAPSTVRHG